MISDVLHRVILQTALRSLLSVALCSCFFSVDEFTRKLHLHGLFSDPLMQHKSVLFKLQHSLVTHFAQFIGHGTAVDGKKICKLLAVKRNCKSIFKIWCKSSQFQAKMSRKITNFAIIKNKRLPEIWNI